MDAEPVADLGVALARLRTARGLSQVQLGAAAGVSHSTIGAMERGEQLPGEPTLFRIGAVLGLAPMGVVALLQDLRYRRAVHARVLAIVERSPGIGSMVAALDDRAVYGQEAQRLLARTIVQMERIEADLAAAAGPARS